MIVVTRLNGPPFAVNPDLLERVEATPDTILTLIDGTKFLVQESVTDIVALVRDYRASVVATARDLGGNDPRREALEADHSDGDGDAQAVRASGGHPHLAAVPSLTDRLRSRSGAQNLTDPSTADEED